MLENKMKVSSQRFAREYKFRALQGYKSGLSDSNLNVEC